MFALWWLEIKHSHLKNVYQSMLRWNLWQLMRGIVVFPFSNKHLFYFIDCWSNGRVWSKEKKLVQNQLQLLVMKDAWKKWWLIDSFGVPISIGNVIPEEGKKTWEEFTKKLDEDEAT